MPKSRRIFWIEQLYNLLLSCHNKHNYSSDADDSEVNWVEPEDEKEFSTGIECRLFVV